MLKAPTDSQFHGNVDEIFSTIALRDGHHYEVRVNGSTDMTRESMNSSERSVGLKHRSPEHP
jgi:hypothetical protein